MQGHIRGRLVIVNVFLLVALLSPANGSVLNVSYSLASLISAEMPKVILQSGTAGTSFIYTNSTSAKVSVSAFEAPTYDYVLKINNTVTYAWKINLTVYSSLNVDRVSNATIRFHDGTTSDQIIISEGVITQSEGPQYDLLGNATRYISIVNLYASTSGTSYLYVYLRILVPSISTYSLFIITFEIT